MVWRAVRPLPFALLPEKPVQLHAVRNWAKCSAVPLIQGSPYVLYSLYSAGPDLDFLLAASSQLLELVHLRQGSG